MPQSGLPPKDWNSNASGHFLTFIVPTVNGCNLRCPFCFISQREEISDTLLAPADYARFIEGVAEVDPVIGVAIQGHEPLLPSSMPYTTAILRAATALGIPASLVTNGTMLRDALPSLRTLGAARIGVSLDAANADRHDRLRGVPGAWNATTSAITAGIDTLSEVGTRLTVISVLMPRKRAYLDGMPTLLRDLGVRDWIVNPLMTIGKEVWAGHDSISRLMDDLLMLSELARRSEIALTIDDERGIIRSKLAALDPEQTARLKIRTLPAGVTLARLTPSGQCSIGHEVSLQASRDGARWRAGDVHPAHFLRASKNGASLAKRALQPA